MRSTGSFENVCLRPTLTDWTRPPTGRPGVLSGSNSIASRSGCRAKQLLYPRQQPCVVWLSATQVFCDDLTLSVHQVLLEIPLHGATYWRRLVRDLLIKRGDV